MWWGRSTGADGWVLINNIHLHLTIVIDPTIIINVCLTNIDIVDGIDCLQVLQHEDGSEKFLTVPTGWKANWKIGPTIDEKGCWIASSAAVDGCPASSANKNNESFPQKGWMYLDGKAFTAGDIQIKCITHS